MGFTVIIKLLVTVEGAPSEQAGLFSIVWNEDSST